MQQNPPLELLQNCRNDLGPIINSIAVNVWFYVLQLFPQIYFQPVVLCCLLLLLLRLASALKGPATGKDDVN